VQFNVATDDEIYGTLLGQTDLSFLAFELSEGIEKLLSTHGGGVISL